MRVSLQNGKGQDCQVKVKVSAKDVFDAELEDSHSFPLKICKEGRNIADEIFSKTVPYTLTIPLRNYGKKLFNALFRRDSLAYQLLQNILPPHQAGRILLELNYQHDLDDIPWEYAWFGEDYLVRQLMFTRVLKRKGAKLPKLPLRIVVVAPNPINANEVKDLHLNDQFQNFIDQHKSNKRQVMLERVFPPTVDKMDALITHKPEAATALHFMGHCTQNMDGTRALVFEHYDSGKHDIANTRRLLSVPKNLRLAYLSACNTREIARTMVESGVPYAVGSYCSLPDDVARKFEEKFYQILANGHSVDWAMYRTRTAFMDYRDYRQRDYLPGAIIIYSSALWVGDVSFWCNEGEPEVNFNMPPNNLETITNISKFCGRKKELLDLYATLNLMATRGKQAHRVFTITGISGQGKTTLAMEVVKRTAHLFPGGVFAWTFDDNKVIDIRDYFSNLMEVLFSKEGQDELILRDGGDNVKLGQRIFKQFKASCLLVLDHANFLKCAESRGEKDAIALVAWLKDVTSKSDISVKILATSYQILGWPREEFLLLHGFVGGDMDSGHRLFIQNLTSEAREKLLNYDNTNTRQLLRELVKHVDGHPLSLIILGRTASRSEHFDKSLQDIVREHYCAMVTDDNCRTKELDNRFGPMINALSTLHRFLLYKCSFCTEPIDEDIIRGFSWKDVPSDHEIRNRLEQLYNYGFLLKDNGKYKNHFAIKEAAKQLNVATIHQSSIANRLSESGGTELGEFKIEIMVESNSKAVENHSVFRRRPKKEQSFKISFIVNIEKIFDHDKKQRYHKIAISFAQVSGTPHLHPNRGYYIEYLHISIRPDDDMVETADSSPPQRLPGHESEDWRIRTGLVPDSSGVSWEYSHDKSASHKVYTLHPEKDLSPHSVTYRWREREPTIYIIDIEEFLGFSTTSANNDVGLVHRATIELNIGQRHITLAPTLRVTDCLWCCNGRNVDAQYKKKASLECECCHLTARLSKR